jgi:antitoxin component YwqK of YwqJK toxin-antitoxin module
MIPTSKEKKNQVNRMAWMRELSVHSAYPFILLLLLLLTGCYRTGDSETMVAIQIQDRNGLTETINSNDKLETYSRTDFLASQPYKKVLRIYRSHGKSQSKITTYHPNGTLWQYLEAEELRANGPYREWHPNGQQRIEAMVIGGPAEVSQSAQKEWLFDGICKVWNEQGQIIALLPYHQGTLEGKSLHYYSNGTLQKEQSYSNHLLEGLCIEYYPNGNIRSKLFYKRGMLEGISLGFYSTQELAWEEEYREDLLIQGTYLKSNQEPISEVKDGRGTKAIFNGDTLTYLVQIQHGIAQGAVKQLSAKGDLLSSYTVKNGQKNGIETMYFPPSEAEGESPMPKLSVNWHENSIHGTVKTWYNNGQLQSQRDYCYNKKMGPTIAWYRDGSLMLVEEYDQDKLVKGQYYKKNALDSISSVIHGHGIATLYDENGVFLRKAIYAKGEVVEPGD